jgi:creatinine amidohydrolase
MAEFILKAEKSNQFLEGIKEMIAGMEHEMLLAKMKRQEVEEAVKRGAAVILPVGTVEQHGYHLPVGTDVAIPTYIAEQATERTGDVVAPPVNYGYNEKDLAFAGTVSVSAETFTRYLVEICRSLAHMGFKRIMILNGHGYNTMVSTAGMVVIEQTDAYCATANWWMLIADVLDELRESEAPGGIAHAGEMETSVQLVLDPEHVDMSRAVKEIDFPFKGSRFVWYDMHQSPISFKPPFQMLTQSGVIGDATIATREKGERILSAAIDRLVEFLEEFKRIVPAEGSKKGPMRPGDDFQVQ